MEQIKIHELLKSLWTGGGSAGKWSMGNAELSPDMSCGALRSHLVLRVQEGALTRLLWSVCASDQELT